MPTSKQNAPQPAVVGSEDVGADRFERGIGGKPDFP